MLLRHFILLKQARWTMLQWHSSLYEQTLETYWDCKSLVAMEGQYIEVLKKSLTYITGKFDMNKSLRQLQENPVIDFS